MISVLDKHLLAEGEETYEEIILYDHIHRLMIQAECALAYGEDAFKPYFSIKAILILFEASGLTVRDGYWDWVNDFSNELFPKD